MCGGSGTDEYGAQCSDCDGAETAFCDVCALLKCSPGSSHCLETLLDGSRGIYVPQEFARRFPEKVKDEDRKVLEEDPDTDGYWEAWGDVLNYVEFTREIPRTGSPVRVRYVLEHDGDLFLRAMSFEKCGG